MVHDKELSFDLPSVGRKKMSAAFDGGRISSDGGVLPSWDVLTDFPYKYT